MDLQKRVPQQLPLSDHRNDVTELLLFPSCFIPHYIDLLEVVVANIS